MVNYKIKWNSAYTKIIAKRKRKQKLPQRKRIHENNFFPANFYQFSSLCLYKMRLNCFNANDWILNWSKHPEANSTKKFAGVLYDDDYYYKYGFGLLLCRPHISYNRDSERDVYIMTAQTCRFFAIELCQSNCKQMGDRKLEYKQTKKKKREAIAIGSGAVNDKWLNFMNQQT